MQEIEALLQDKAEEDFQYLTFFVSGEQLAIDVAWIVEIIEVGALTDVPLAPDFIRGVVNLRGAVLPVVDLSVRLGRSRNEITKRSCIVVVGGAGKPSIGMLVDEVSEILEIAPDLVQPPPALGNGIRTDFIKGMGRLDDRFIVLLDMSRLLSMQELQTIEDIAQERIGSN